MGLLHGALALMGLGGLLVGLPPAGEAQGPPIAMRIRRVMDSLAAHGFSGVVVVVQGEQTIVAEAYGAADPETSRPNRLDTRFNLASSAKLFTAMAIRQLAAAGTVNLDSTLGHYWPDYPNAEVARRVTVGQLLDHTAGIGGSIFDPPAGVNIASLRHNEQFVPLFAARPLEFEPGTKTEYSNAGYVLLGGVVQRASGTDYYRYIADHVFGPAGMTQRGWFALDSLPPNTARGFTREDESPRADTLGRHARHLRQDGPSAGPLRANTESLPGRGSAAGGGYSTAPDLVRLLQAIRAGRVAGAASDFVQGGGSPGVNTWIAHNRPAGYDIVVLANADPPAALQALKAIWAELRTP